MEDKFCPKCSVTKPLSEWLKNRARYDGYSSWCKSCTSDYQKERNQRPEVAAEKSRKSAEKYAAMSEEERKQYNERGMAHQRKTGYSLRQKYGMSIEDYDSMLQEQGGGCAICGKNPSQSRRLSVDHDHACCPGSKTCGQCVRGLLCISCNVWLGFYENEEWMQRAKDYLARAR